MKKYPLAGKGLAVASRRENKKDEDSRHSRSI